MRRKIICIIPGTVKTLYQVESNQVPAYIIESQYRIYRTSFEGRFHNRKGRVIVMTGIPYQVPVYHAAKLPAPVPVPYSILNCVAEPWDCDDVAFFLLLEIVARL